VQRLLGPEDGPEPVQAVEFLSDEQRDADLGSDAALDLVGQLDRGGAGFEVWRPKPDVYRRHP
jgi:hypothetical protein